jgi:hypothetical protein
VTHDGSVLCAALLRQQKGIARYLRPVPASPERFLFATPERDTLFEDFIVPIQTSVLRAASTRGFRFDESLRSSEDWDLVLRLALAGKRFGFIDRVHCDGYVHGGNLASDGRFPARVAAEQCKVWSKMLTRRDLTPARRSLLRGRIAALRVWEGYELLDNGDRAAARTAFCRSLRNRPTWLGLKGLLGSVLVPRWATRGSGVTGEEASCRP